MNPRVLTNEPEMIRMAVHILQKEGWVCIPPDQAPGGMYSPADLGRRFDLKPTALHRRLYSGACPAFFGEYGRTGRLLRIKLSPDLETYLKRPLRTKGAH